VWYRSRKACGGRWIPCSQWRVPEISEIPFRSTVYSIRQRELRFKAAVNEIAAALHAATGPEQQLELLLVDWGFQLPTASAILTVLLPDQFTIYDIRLCDSLHTFHRLGGLKWSHEVWEEYQRFIVAVRHSAPRGLSLRDCDRWLWGRNKRDALLKELAEPGGQRAPRGGTNVRATRSQIGQSSTRVKP
jgi:hypothetical protein